MRLAGVPIRCLHATVLVVVIVMSMTTKGALLGTLVGPVLLIERGCGIVSILVVLVHVRLPISRCLVLCHFQSVGLQA